MSSGIEVLETDYFEDFRSGGFEASQEEDVIAAEPIN